MFSHHNFRKRVNAKGCPIRGTSRRQNKSNWAAVMPRYCSSFFFFFFFFFFPSYFAASLLQVAVCLAFFFFFFYKIN